MYHGPIDSFRTAHAWSRSERILTDMTALVAANAERGASFTPDSIRKAGFDQRDIDEFYADAVAAAQTSLWWPRTGFVAVEGI